MIANIPMLLIFFSSNWAVTTENVIDWLTDEIFANIPQLPSPADKEILREAEMDMAEISRVYGYGCENYTVNTKDGFILTIYRLISGKRTRNITQPILIMHGMFTSSRTWLDNQNNNLVFYLAELGYDVWIGNFRGNFYTRHVKYSRNQFKYWDFCLDDMANKDLPAMTDAILEKTESEKLALIADSLGTTVGFAFLSSMTNYQQKIAGYIALAPIDNIQYIPSYLRQVVKEGDFLGSILQTLRIGSLLSVPPKATKVAQYACPVKNTAICEFIINSFSGYDPYIRNITRDFIIIAHENAGLPTRIIKQYSQAFKKKGLYKYDYGSLKNLKVYNSTTPPAYNLTKIAIPVVLIHGANDVMADPLGVCLLSRKLPNLMGIKLVDDPMFSHSDMLAASNDDFFYKDVKSYLGKMFQ